MTLYFVTARDQTNPHHYLTWKKEPVSFSSRGWAAFAEEMVRRQPNLGPLLDRLNRPTHEYPRHPSYTLEDQPLALVWTEAECRELFQELVLASNATTESAYDFWEFMGLICCGINEEGVCVY